MRAFNTYGAARKYGMGGPVLRVGKLYLAEPTFDPVSFGLTSVELVAPNGNVSATVTLRHLERLGNANYAEPRNNHPFGYTSGQKVFTTEMFK